MNPLALRKSPAQLALLLALGLPMAAIAASDQPVRAAPANKFDAWRYGDQQVTWKSGPFVELCTRNRAACVMAKIPKSLGKIEAVVPGPFIQRARASWIAQSRFGSFLCAALSGKSVVACVRIEGDALPLRYLEVDVEITANNQSRISLKGKSAAVDRVRVGNIEKTFRKRYLQAVHLLQGEADHASASRSSMMSTTNVCDHGLGTPPHPDCVEVEESGVWMWSCPIVGENPPDPGPQPDPDPFPEPEPYPDPDPDC